MPLIRKRKLIDLGNSKVVTIPKGHTLLEKSKTVTIIANSLIVLAPENKDRKKIKKDLLELIEEI